MKTPLALAAALGLVAPAASAYPLDGFPWTGIKRLEAYRLAAQGSRRPSFLTEGEMLPSISVRLNLVDEPGFTVPPPDSGLSAQLLEMLGRDAPGYGIALLDYSDPARPRYASYNPDRPQNPGSVGKIMVLLAWFQALADVHPDVEDRRRLLLETEIEADAFIRTDTHDVPVWDFGATSVDRRPIEEGDRANLWTFLDWMASASSNAAASLLMEHLVLLVHFGERYPVPQAEAEAWLAATPQKELSRIFLDAMRGPAERNGLDLDKLRQGHFFSREGKSRIPGVHSVSTAGELLHYMVLMEQGKLVDPFSSLEIKRLLYLTDQRIRYASSPALDESAVYFKSGSLYGCKPEKGFDCGKLRGNRMNFMNSMVIVESVDRSPPIRYAVVVLSNVLRKDSSELHKQLGADLHAIIESFHPIAPAGVGDAAPGAGGAKPAVSGATSGPAPSSE
jgi:hypothetical protein